MKSSHSTRQKRKPTAHLFYSDSEGRVYRKDLPRKTVKILSECLAVNPPSLQFPDEWLTEAMQFTLATRDKNELFAHPEYDKDKVPPQDAIRLLIEAMAVPFAVHEGNISPYYAMLTYSTVYRGFMRSLLEYKPI